MYPQHVVEISYVVHFQWEILLWLVTLRILPSVHTHQTPQGSLDGRAALVEQRPAKLGPPVTIHTARQLDTTCTLKHPHPDNQGTKHVWFPLITALLVPSVWSSGITCMEEILVP